MEIGRLISLLELIESFLRLVSSKPMESGNLISLLKFAFSSSNDLKKKKENKNGNYALLGVLSCESFVEVMG